MTDWFNDYDAHIEHKGEIIATGGFRAKNIKAARIAAQRWKSREGYKGRLVIRRV